MPMRPPGHGQSPFRGTVSLSRAARLWNLPRREVRRLVQQGKLPFIQVMGRIRVPRSVLSEFTKSSKPL